MAAYKPLWSHILDHIIFDKIYVSEKKILKKTLFKENPLQALIVYALLDEKGFGVTNKKGRVLIKRKYNERELLFISQEGSEKAEIEYPGIGYIDYEFILNKIPKRPLFVFENRLYLDLVEEDRARTLFQLSLTISTIRKWLWDKHLVMLNTPEVLRKEFNRLIPKNKVLFLDPRKFVDMIEKKDKIIALDPYAESVLNERVLYESTIIVLGGIVDRSKPLKKATTKIVDSLSREIGIDIERYRLEIDGITMAIPHRLNKIVEILLKTLVDKIPLRQAIISVMTNRDIAWYLGLLYAKYKDRDLLFEKISEIERIKKKKISKDVLKRAYKIAGI
ncbi:MAG: hypothetical protein DRO40_00680 [Thermoprotei archaeon]|nr:MAG: hypothetical protein DRO40_00680 [Thermoprotei archaeon]